MLPTVGMTMWALLKQQSHHANPASECLDWSPVNLFALPLSINSHQQSAKVL
jgi:hypothetical protein